jgi:hypothetical protein
MSSALLSEWMAYDRIAPLHDPYWIGAHLCQVIANSFAAKGKGFKLEDFLPVRPSRSRPAGPRPTAAESAGILGRRYRENEARAVKEILSR